MGAETVRVVESFRPQSGVRDYAVHALLLAFLLIPVFPAVFSRGEQIVPGGLLYDVQPWKSYTPANFTPTANKPVHDALCMFHLYYVLGQRSFANGEWPLWNPYEFTGIPLLANAQSAFFYPPRLLHAIFDVNTATTLFILLKLWLCGMTSFLCGRGIGLSSGSARFLSSAWMLSSFNLIWCYWAEPDVAAWLPIMLLGAEKTLSERYRAGFCAIAFSATLMLLAGHPESAFAMGFSIGVYLVLRLLVARKWGTSLWKTLAVAASAWIVALLCTSVQTLPFIEYLRNSYQYAYRPVGEVPTHSLPASSWVLFFVPRFYGVTAKGTFWGDYEHSSFLSTIFPGIAIWFGLSLLIYVRGNGREKSRRVLCLCAVCLLCFLLAFDFSGLSQLQQLPVFSAMWRLWYAGPALFLLQLLAAIGFDIWLAKPRSVRTLIPTFVVAAIVGAGVWYTYQFNLRFLTMKHLDATVFRQLEWAAGIAALCILALTAYSFSNRKKLCALALSCILALDLTVAIRDLLPTAPSAWLYPETKLTKKLQFAGIPIRVETTGANLPTGFLAAYGIEEWLGYDGLLPLRIYRFFKEMGEDSWKSMQPALGINVFLHDTALTPKLYQRRLARDRLRFGKRLDGIDIYEDPASLPRAFLVSKTKEFPNFEQMLAYMRAGEFEPAKHVLLEEPAPELDKNEPGASPGTAEVTLRKAERVEIHVDAKSPAMLVLADAYYPGWKATIDGVPTHIYAAYSIFRGVVVSPGNHRVEFVFHPDSFYVGLVISTFSLILGALLGAYWLSQASNSVRKRKTY